MKGSDSLGSLSGLFRVEGLGLGVLGFWVQGFRV